MDREITKDYSLKICNLLERSEEYQTMGVIYFYYPMRNEVNLLPLAEKALRMGKLTGFPKVEGNIINFYQVSSLAQFQEGNFQVMEPVSKILLTEERPLILTPGVAFDKNKNRMGYGRGYYDRYGAGFPGSIRIGTAYDSQVVDEIPADGLDIPMHKIVTESGMW